MKKLCLGLSLLAMSCQALAQDSDSELKPTMHSLAANLQSIIPMIFVPQEDLNDNSDALKQEVGQLVQAFQLSKDHFKNKTPVFKASYDVTLEYLQQTKQYLNDGKISLAADKLKMLPSMCVSCHTQDTKQNSSFFGLEREAFSSDFEFAELCFATRDYGTAIRYFDRFLTQPGSFKSKDRSETALERLLTLYVQVDGEPTMAGTYLNEYLPFITEFPDLKVRLESWVESLGNLPQNQIDLLSGKKTLNFENLKSLASPLEQNRASKDEVHTVVLRGLVHSYLNRGPDNSEIPALLYWLALADKRLNYMYYQSFAEVYLKECATNYEGEYANKCKKELEGFQSLA